MADLSAVLRKTIDGLPKATPELRAKVYDKARAAIVRQIESASPPLSEQSMAARRAAIEDAIDRTEEHYLERDLGEAFNAEPQAPEARPVPPLPQPPRADALLPRRPQPEPPQPVARAPSLPHVDNGPKGTIGGVQKPAWPKAEIPGRTGADPVPGTSRELRRDPMPRDRAPSPAATGDATAAGGRERRPSPGAASSDNAAGEDAPRPAGRRASTTGEFPPPPLPPFPPSAVPKRSPGLDTSDIPAADFAAPRYANGRRAGGAARGRAPMLAGLAIVLLGAGGALAYVYQDEVQSYFSAFGQNPTRSAATDTPPPAAPPVTPTTPPAATAEPAGDAGTDVAALAPGVEAPAEEPAAETPASAETVPPASTRRFTQRLLPDGTEVDEGPGARNANAFEEGTNIAAASPETLPATDQGLAAAPAPETPPGDASVTALAAPAATPPAATAVPAPATTTTAALEPDSVAGVPAVAQKAVFYEERSETERGTQLGGNVVWSVVSEPPTEGQPPEPAIRAVADVPEENIKLTMTIRRNADSTLPASHVIELMFEVPPTFAGGQIANVQRLALKPTEESLGEPLIGVAGKISDGFFVIALNNLAQATQTNLELMGKEQWIDIPLAYATGRRALMSLEKGIPGDRVFKEAMAAWAEKT